MEVMRRFVCRSCLTEYSITEVVDAEEMEPVYCPFCGDWPSDEDDDVGPEEQRDDA